MSDTRTGRPIGTEPTVTDLADDFVTAVCRPGDVEAARATVRRVDPVDLAGLVAAVDDHQPMTLEVAVDVLAELGVGPASIAAAVGVDHEDVQVLLGAPLGGPPPPLPDRDARIIEVVAGQADDRLDADAGPVDVDAAEPDDVAEDDTDDVETAAVAADDATGTDDADPGPGADAGGSDDVFADARDDAATATTEPVGPASAPVRIDSAGDREGARDEPGEATPTLGPTPGPAPGAAAPSERSPSRGRVVWAVVLFVLLIGGMVALAALLGAF